MVEHVLSSLAAGGPMAMLLGFALWYQVRENRKIRALYEGDPGDGRTPPTIGRLEALRREYEGDPEDLANKPGKLALARAELEASSARWQERLSQERATFDKVKDDLHAANAAILREIAQTFKDLAKEDD